LAKKTYVIQSTLILPDERTSGKIVLVNLERAEPLWFVHFGPLCRSRQASPKGNLAANKVRLNCLLTELEELSIDAVADNLLGGQLEMTEVLFRETYALQAECEQDLEARERKAAIEDWAKSRRRFLEARARAQGRLRPKHTNWKLLILTLPQFDGEVLKFPTFLAQFEASVHADTELEDAPKFAYLLSNTTGRALCAISGIPITAANYTQKFLEFAQLQADSLSPPEEFSPEASREEKGGKATRKELITPGRMGETGPHHQLQRWLPAIFGRRILGSDEHVPCKGRLLQSLLAARSTPGSCLQIVRARAYRPDGNHVLVNCLCVTGDEVSFIRKDVAEVFGLTASHERCRFTTLGGRVGPERKWRRVEFRLGAVGSSGQAETCTPVQALAIPQFCGRIQPVPTRSAGRIPAEPEMGQRPGAPLLIDVLIDIDYYYEYATGRIRRTTSGTVAVETRLGWLVCGKTDARQSPKTQVLLTKDECSDDDILRSFWEI
ncbi:hypothetical protein T03_12313, partial [Trichinella britovi]